MIKISATCFAYKMVHCIAFGCNNKNTEQKKGISFHRLPKDEKLKKVWLAKLRLKCPPKNLDNVRVCSEHFTPDSFVPDMQAKFGFKKAVARLRDNAIPSIFVFTKQLQPRETSMRRAELAAKKQVSWNLSLESNMLHDKNIK